MDWNNINIDRDTSGLGPIEYDQSKVPTLIRKHANNVRTKTYGQEVREAQARNAEYAGLIASKAESKANNADLLSKDTQNRFKDQIEGTTNSDEVIDARRPQNAVSYRTIGERLEQMRLKIVNVRDFGATGDGITDDTDAVLMAASQLTENSVLFFPQAEYVLSQVIEVTSDKTFVHGDNSTIYWSGTGNSYLDKTGIFTFKGEMTSNYLNTKQNIVSIQNDSLLGTKITLNSHDFQVGDRVLLVITPLKWDKSGKDYKPYSRVTTTVNRVSGNDVYVDYDYIFDFASFEKSEATLTKTEQLKNVGIKDFKIINLVNDISLDTANCVSMIGVDDYFVDNMTFEAYAGVGLLNNNSTNGEIGTVKGINPINTTAGAGYGIKNESSSHIDFKAIRGYNVRHLIDFSGSLLCDVYDADSNTASHGTFDMHGIGEHDITYTKVQGNFTFGNGISEFPEVIESIKIVDSVIFGRSNGFNSGHDIQIINSKIYLKNLLFGNRMSDVTFEKSKLFLENVTFQGSNRGGHFKDTYLKFIESQIFLKNSDFLETSVFNKVVFSKTKVEPLQLTVPKIVFKEVNFVDFEKSDLKNVRISLEDAFLEIRHLLIDDCKVNFTMPSNFFGINTNWGVPVNSFRIFEFRNSVFETTADATLVRMVDYIVDVGAIFKSRGNTFVGRWNMNTPSWIERLTITQSDNTAINTRFVQGQPFHFTDIK